MARRPASDARRSASNARRHVAEGRERALQEAVVLLALARQATAASPAADEVQDAVDRPDARVQPLGERLHGCLVGEVAGLRHDPGQLLLDRRELGGVGARHHDARAPPDSGACGYPAGGTRASREKDRASRSVVVMVSSCHRVTNVGGAG